MNNLRVGVLPISAAQNAPQRPPFSVVNPTIRPVVAAALAKPLRRRGWRAPSALGKRYTHYIVAGIVHAAIFAGIGLLAFSTRRQPVQIIVEAGVTNTEAHYTPPAPPPQVLVEKEPPPEKPLAITKPPEPTLEKPQPEPAFAPPVPITKQTDPLTLKPQPIERPPQTRPPTPPKKIMRPISKETPRPPVKTNVSQAQQKKGVRRRAEFLKRPAPVYPNSCRIRGHQGAVVLKVEVLRNGTIGKISVVEDSGCARMVAAAKTAVRNARFLPATLDGTPIRSTHLVPFRFNLALR